MAVCDVCFRQCVLREGQAGACGARVCRNGTVVPLWYGRLSSLALDPIEKKPLLHFHPGSLILSAGSLGCNLTCPFCQNHTIAHPDKGGRQIDITREIPPDALADMAVKLRGKGNIGLAFTYNEPLVGYEYVVDAAREAHKRGMLNVMVTNGTAHLHVLEALAPFIDAMNIDLKGFGDHYYRDVLRGDKDMVMAFIREAVKICHVEITCLIVPGENDSIGEMDALSAWTASLTGVHGGKTGRDIPLHITRFFPRWHMTNKPPTPIKTLDALAAAAGAHLKNVHIGNVF